jgi:transcription elongation factor GreA
VSEVDPNAISREGLERLRAEVEELETTGRREGAERIRIAREWGDLKENAEYHDAKNSLALLERRITILRERLDNAVVMETDSADGDEVVRFGSTVEVVDETSGRPAEYTLVGEAEADVGKGLLSADSPVGRALQGARVGDVVSVPTPRGSRELRVARLGAA